MSALLSKRWFPWEACPWSSMSWGADEKLAWLRSQVVGADAEVDTPFGHHKKMVYVDHTASGKPLHFVEDFMLHNVLPFYGKYIVQCYDHESATPHLKSN